MLRPLERLRMSNRFYSVEKLNWDDWKDSYSPAHLNTGYGFARQFMRLEVVFNGSSYHPS